MKPVSLSASVLRQTRLLHYLFNLTVISDWVLYSDSMVLLATMCQQLKCLKNPILFKDNLKTSSVSRDSSKIKSVYTPKCKRQYSNEAGLIIVGVHNLNSLLELVEELIILKQTQRPGICLGYRRHTVRMDGKHNYQILGEK